MKCIQSILADECYDMLFVGFQAIGIIQKYGPAKNGCTSAYV